MQELKALIEKVWDDRALLSQPLYKEAVEEVIALLDRGGVRVAEPASEEAERVLWQVNEWVKKAVLLYFSVAEMRVMEVGPYE
ncbi:MAG: 2,3,4,5-tetrahydropyridine-2,6-dicarboxylate N-succinyltransferase, partial [Bacteroidales bacterium]|nr:2,3,4,5-tetrahydropyridine-2,6-dicarboxylate N-succinyltransferase [Bacteroidales bacterium]